MKVTADQMKAAIDARLPAYFSSDDPQLHAKAMWGLKGSDHWFSLRFRYPGAKPRYVWVSLKEDMTEEEVDQWATDAAVQVKLTQTIDELNDRAKVMEQNLALKR
jgi:hypothetical protein